MSAYNLYRIGIKEFSYLVYSPIGWIVLTIFAVQSGYGFFSLFDAYYERLALGDGPGSFAEALFTTSFRSVFSNALRDVYIFIPLITMAVFAREYQTGSIKLLMSSPVHASEIVLGKFLGVLVYFSFFIFTLVIFAIFASYSVPQFDWPALLPGFLGLYLLVATYASIGIFVSSLSQHQIIAAIVTLAILFVLQSIEGWFQTTPILNEITAWASLSGRGDVFRAGLISTAHVAYFLCIISLFVSLTVIRLSALRSSAGWLTIFVRGISVAAMAAIVGWVLSLPQLNQYLDTTYDQRNSLAPESVELMNRLEGPWEIVTYANIIDRMGRAAWPSERIRDRLRYERYRAINPNLFMRYFLYYDIDGASDVYTRPEDSRSDQEIIEDYGQRVGLDVESIPPGQALDEQIALDLEREGFRSLRVVRWNGREAILRHFNDATRFPAERTRAAAIKSLLDGPRRVGVGSNAGERSIDGFGPKDFRVRFTERTHRFSLINHGFDFVNLTFDDPVPDEIDLVMIADPREPYNNAQILNIREFVRRGGDFVLLLEPDSPLFVDTILEDLGLSRGEQVFQNDVRYPEDFLLADALSDVVDAYWGASAGDNSQPVIMDGAVSLRAQDNDRGFKRLDVLKVADDTMGYALTRAFEDHEQRIIVFGDADLFSTANTERGSPVSLTTSAFGTFHWLTNGEFPVQRTRREPIDGDIQISGWLLEILRWVFVGLLPLGILAYGTAMLAIRRRQ